MYTTCLSLTRIAQPFRQVKVIDNGTEIDLYSDLGETVCFVDRNSKEDSAMHLLTRPATVLALLIPLSMLLAASDLPAQTDDPRALDGEWIYVEDLTEGRALEQQEPVPIFGLRLKTQISRY